MNIQTFRFSQKISEIKENLFEQIGDDMINSFLYTYKTLHLIANGFHLYHCFDAWVSIKYILRYYIYILKIAFYCLQMQPLPIGESLSRMWFITNIIAGEILRNNQNCHIPNKDNEIN